GFTRLHDFAPTDSSGGTNSDGYFPSAGLLVSGSTLYGTARMGGTLGPGTVFAVNTDGAGFTTLHNFSAGSDGAFPQAALILSGDTLYGTAPQGGSSGPGTVFAVNSDGPGLTTLHSFTVVRSGTNQPAALNLSG